MSVFIAFCKKGSLWEGVGSFLLLLIRLYQWLLSPLLLPCCRFHPSCSHFAFNAIQTYGPKRGVVLALGRLLRCHPFARGGFDPLPEKKLSMGKPTHLTADPGKRNFLHG